MAIRRFMGVVAVLTMSVQLALTAATALVVCAATEHRHNGRPAPDCPMHHSDGSQSQPAAHEHHHHSGPQPDSGTRLTCGCSSDLPAFLIVGSAPVSTPVAVAQPVSARAMRSDTLDSLLERFVTPLTPPPRFILV
jgi:hypothetical protein